MYICTVRVISLGSLLLDTHSVSLLYITQVVFFYVNHFEFKIKECIVLISKQQTVINIYNEKLYRYFKNRFFLLTSINI